MLPVARSFLHVAPCPFPFTCYFLLVTFCLLLLTRYSLLYACYYFPLYFVIYCSLFCLLVTTICSFLLSFRLTFHCNYASDVLISFNVVLLLCVVISSEMMMKMMMMMMMMMMRFFFHTLRCFCQFLSIKICSFTRIFYSFKFF